MSDPSSPCPDDDTLARLLEGALPPVAAGRIRAHLGGCRTCAELVSETVREAPRESSRVFEEVGILGARAGDILGERFRLVRWIAAGRMGSVWEVEDLWGEHALYAVKLIATADAAARLTREARLLEQLAHPNIVRTVAFLELGDVKALVLERLYGESLQARLTRSGPLPLTEAVGVLRAVARALDHAHGQGIVHRDIKPSTVVLALGTPRVRVVDFGLAAPTRAWSSGTLTSLTVTGASVGTPIYMAPEQLFGEEIREPADLWALGLLAHEMLAGSLPFESAPLGKLLRSVRTAPFVPLSQRVSFGDSDVARTAGSRLDGLVSQWLASDAQSRGTSAGAALSLAAVGDSLGVDELW
jgi:serine/threonine-protein kinase